MKTIKFISGVFILLSVGMRLYANHSYYCDCKPAVWSDCQCTWNNGHPVRWSNGKIAGKVGLGRWVSTTIWINCTAPHALVPPDGLHAEGPHVWKSSGAIGCAQWQYPRLGNTKNAYIRCANRNPIYKHYINIQYITCTRFS